MSLYTDNTQIIINRGNNILFDSDGKLLYKQAELSGSFSLGGTTSVQTIDSGIGFIPEKMFAIVSITLTSGTGSLVAPYLNTAIDLTFPLQVHADGYIENSQQQYPFIWEFDLLTTNFYGNSAGNLEINIALTGSGYILKFDGSTILNNKGTVRRLQSTSSLSGTYKVTILAYA